MKDKCLWQLGPSYFPTKRAGWFGKDVNMEYSKNVGTNMVLLGFIYISKEVAYFLKREFVQCTLYLYHFSPPSVDILASVNRSLHEKGDVSLGGGGGCFKVMY